MYDYKQKIIGRIIDTVGDYLGINSDYEVIVNNDFTSDIIKSIKKSVLFDTIKRSVMPNEFKDYYGNANFYDDVSEDVLHEFECYFLSIYYKEIEARLSNCDLDMNQGDIVTVIDSVKEHNSLFTFDYSLLMSALNEEYAVFYNSQMENECYIDVSELAKNLYNGGYFSDFIFDEDYIRSDLKESDNCFLDEKIINDMIKELKHRYLEQYGNPCKIDKGSYNHSVSSVYLRKHAQVKLLDYKDLVPKAIQLVLENLNIKNATIEDFSNGKYVMPSTMLNSSMKDVIGMNKRYWYEFVDLDWQELLLYLKNN